MNEHYHGQQLVFLVDLDERGSFCAHIEDPATGKSIFECTNEDPDTGWPDEDGFWLVRDGFMRHNRDVDGLRNYLIEVGIIHKDTMLSMLH